MDFSCKHPSYCAELALWECHCTQRPRFCDIHLRPHKSKCECKEVNFIEKEYTEIFNIINLAKNDLDELEISIINIAKFMTKEIKNCFDENMNLIKDKKNIVQNYLIEHKIGPVEPILIWAKKFEIESRNKSIFSSNVLFLLSIKEDVNRQIINFETLKDEAKKYKTMHEEALELIEKLKKSAEEKEMKISEYIKNYEESIAQAEKSKKDIEDLSEEIKKLKNKLKDKKETIIKLSKNIDELKLSEKNLSKNLGETKENCEKSRKTLKMKENTIALYKGKIDDLEAREKKSNAKLEETSEKITSLDELYAKAKVDIINKSNDYDKLKTQAELNKKILEDALETVEILKKKIQDKVSITEISETKYKELSAISNINEKKIEEMSIEINVLNNTILENDKLILNLKINDETNKKEIKKSTENFEELKKISQEQRESLSKCQTEKNKFDLELKDYKNKLEKSLEEINSLTIQLQDKEKDIKSLNKSIENLKAENKTSKDNNDISLKTIKELTNDNKKYKEESQNNKNKYEAAGKTIEKLRKNLQEQENFNKKNCDDLKAQNVLEKGKLNQATKEIEDLKNDFVVKTDGFNKKIKEFEENIQFYKKKLQESVESNEKKVSEIKKYRSLDLQYENSPRNIGLQRNFSNEYSIFEIKGKNDLDEFLKMNSVQRAAWMFKFCQGFSDIFFIYQIDKISITKDKNIIYACKFICRLLAPYR